MHFKTFTAFKFHAMRWLLATMLTGASLLPATGDAAVQVSHLGIRHGADNHAWTFIYDSAAPTAPKTGLDLFSTLFGAPVASGTYTDGFGFTNPYLTMGDASNGVGLISYGFGLFLESITLDGTSIAMDPLFAETWSYFAAGGLNGDGPTGSDSPADGAWSPAQLGFADRLIGDGSFDGWSFGAFGSGAPSFEPLITDPVFANAQVIRIGSLVPEPRTAGLCALAVVLAVTRRSRPL